MLKLLDHGSTEPFAAGVLPSLLDVDAVCNCRLCSKEDSLSSETGAVKKCMISHRTELLPGCQQELGRSLHMSFFVWQPKGIMTEPCDADVQKLCLSQAPDVKVAPGAVSNCLADVVSVAACGLCSMLASAAGGPTP